MSIFQVSMDPGAITAQANEAIYAGAFVKADGSAAVVTSLGMSSYASGDIKCLLCNAVGDDALCIGIASEAASSGDMLTIYTEGIFIVRCSETSMSAGTSVTTAENDYEEVDAVVDTEEEFKIGKSLTYCNAADDYIIIKLNI